MKNDAIGNTDDCMESTLSNLGKSITSFQIYIGGIERQASKLNKVGLVELKCVQFNHQILRILSSLMAKWSGL